MQLAISNIAWAPHEAESVYGLLGELGVAGLEIAPGLLFAGEDDPFSPPESAVADRLRTVERAGLTLVSMQSLLFGLDNAALFGEPLQRETFRYGLERAIRLAGRLGIPNLVVGSPKNRVIPAHMGTAEAERIARDVFRSLGDVAAAANCVMALEPNPSVYGTNFLTTMEETSAFVRTVDHGAVTLNFDLGSLHLNGNAAEAATMMEAMRDQISHVHISEPHLGPVPADPGFLQTLFAHPAARHCRAWASIEMRSTSGTNLPHVRRSVESCIRAMAGTIPGR